MTTTKFLRSPAPLAASLLMAGLPLGSFAQTPAAASGSAPAATVWQQCTALSDGNARLACFDQWAQQQSQQPLASPQGQAVATTPAASANAMVGLTPPASALAAADAPAPAPIGGCRNDGYTEMSRFWELEAGTDCGTFSFRGYRPLSVSFAVGDKVNRQPSSLNPVNSATTETDYQKQEMRIQLSVRTKLAQNLLTDPNGKLRDSLWIGYTGLSYWQVFNSDLSRPFRTTDHQPEIFYVYPTTAQLPFGWRWRYSGIGLEHQSNGQSDPLSRSWNRTYLMTGFELDNRLQLQAKIWHRINESAEDDNNPNIQNYIGRSELKLGWNVNQRNWMGVTARGSLNGHGKGSGRVEWMHTLGDGWMGGKSNLRLHAQVFHGYGDSLIDYNYKRTVFSLGFSLLDF
ncbi:phospholipase A [Comamonas sp.]|uniref:phospholipase A n=1 Tax=Comamonas sp. TaxID=34028 RepID=UPI00289F8AB4|nr:phospholipase A [Comamonas sp.]